MRVEPGAMGEEQNERHRLTRRADRGRQDLAELGFQRQYPPLRESGRAHGHEGLGYGSKVEDRLGAEPRGVAQAEAPGPVNPLPGGDASSWSRTRLRDLQSDVVELGIRHVAPASFDPAVRGPLSYAWLGVSREP